MSSAVDRVRHLLRDRGQADPAPLFVQMDEYEPEPIEDGPKVYKEWLEVRRWIRYEECVEGQGERWSKPHVSTVSLQAMLDLKEELSAGCVDLNCTATNITQLLETVVRLITKTHSLMNLQTEAIQSVLSMPHRPQFTLRDRNKKEQKEQVQNTPQLNRHRLVDNSGDPEVPPVEVNATKVKVDKRFTRKLPSGAEAANIFIGELSQLSYTVACFIRLKEPFMMKGVTEVEAKTRYLFVILGPRKQVRNKAFLEMGRCIATVLCDEVFQQVCHNSKSADDLVAGMDEFLEAVTLLPPSSWGPSMRIDPPAQRPETRRKDLETFKKAADIGDCESFTSSRWDEEEEEAEEEEDHVDPALIRSGRLFGGLVNDVKRRLPWYLSDYKDALHVQCLSSVIFLYFAAFTPIVAFGAILGEGTDNYMASMECIIAGALCGVIYHLFAGQALTVLGPTGPMMVLEIIVFHFAEDHSLNFLSFRLWIGLWTSLFLLIFVMFDLSSLVAYITRFTEEAFAFLISAIFIYDAIKKVVDIKDYNDTDKFLVECFCNPPLNHTAQKLLMMANMANETVNGTIITTYITPQLNHTIQEEVMYYEQMGDKECFENNGTLMGCHHVGHSREIFHLSIIWFLLTFTIATALNWFRSCRFPRAVRNVVSDFCVFVAIVIVTGADALIGAGTPKLVTPTKFRPSRHDRGWLVPPMANLPWWAPLAACLPAILATILIFMDQQITAVIVNRKDNKMKKGTGYHLDLLVVAILVALCSLLGLPWYVASTVVAITHVTSLRKMSECTAPGEVPQFTGIREQRVTGILAHIMVGLSILFTPLLTKVPMPVLYGVFLYMGVSSLNGLSILTRIRLMITPPKYQPDYKYLRVIPIRRIHLFTVIQIICLILLLIIKKIKIISMGFPIMVVGLCFVRNVIIERLFTPKELKKLDNLLPKSLKPKATTDDPVSNKDKKLEELNLMNGGTLPSPANESEVPLVSPTDEKVESMDNGAPAIHLDSNENAAVKT